MSAFLARERQHSHIHTRWLKLGLLLIGIIRVDVPFWGKKRAAPTTMEAE